MAQVELLKASDNSQPRQLLPDIIFVSLEDWDEIWRRNQFLCARLAHRFPDMKILFVVPPRNVARHLRAGRIGPLLGDASWRVPGHPNIIVTSPLRVGPERFGWGIRINQILARAHVRKMAKRFALERPLLWLNPHYAVHKVGRMNEAAVVYDITDDWTLASGSPREQRITREQDAQLCGAADLVIVCSESLLESRRSLAKRVLLLPNGVDARHYEAVCRDGRPATSNEPSRKPVFGYTGTLHPDRIDSNIILALARAFPEGTVILIGPDHLPEPARRALKAAGNVILHGPVPYAEIPQQMARFDVCIVPHVESKFTDSLNPIKLWEYLAGGKPIVSTNVAGFRDFAHLCRVASGPERFVEACRDALTEGTSLTAARRATAAEHSWDARVERLLEELKELGCPK
jgi:glycosyltransferase involved in cell wall biosynthesis